jgi:hypothetical protein
VPARRFGRALVAGLLAAGALVGCGVPDSGDPVAVPNKKLEQGSQAVNADLVGPRPEGTAKDTIALLLDAGGRTQNRDRIAEKFLTPRAQEAWKRAATDALLYRLTETTIVGQTESTAVLRLGGTVTGSVTDLGVYRPQNRPLTFSVNLVKQGVWLIDSALPAGLVRDTEFESSFLPVPLYFPVLGGDTGGGRDDVLVPELRFMDRNAPEESLLTPIVRALLRGPSPWLAPVTRNPLPKNTALRGNVTLADLNSDVVVDLSQDVESAKSVDLKAFTAQVAWSLRAYFERDVRLQVNGQSLAVPGVDAVQGLEHWGRYNAMEGPSQQLYYVSKGVLRRHGEVETSVDTIPGGKDATSGVLTAAVSLDGLGVAVVKQASAGRQALWIGAAQGPLQQASLGPATLYGRSISRPTWGHGHGGVLVSVDGVLYRVDRGGAASKVSAPGIRGPIRAIRLAPDGARLAVVIGDGAGAKAYVGLLQPVADSAVPILRDLRPLVVPVARIQDVGWSFDTPGTVLVAGQGADNSALVREASVDGAVTSETSRTGLPQGALWLATSPLEGTATFVESGRQLYQIGSRRWTRLPEIVDGRAPFYPG